MRCLTCGEPITGPVCVTCGTPAGAAPLWPGVPVRSVHGLGVAAASAVAVAVAADLGLGLYPLLGRRLAGEALNRQDAALLDRAVELEAILTIPLFVSYLVVAVLLITWLYRARKNIDAFPGATATMGAGWAIGGWFVPFANLVIPCRVMSNVANSSLIRRNPGPLVVLWWLAWLASNLCGQASSVRDADAYAALPLPVSQADYQEYVDYWGQALTWNAWDMITTTVAGAALIILLLWIGRAQQDRIARGAVAQPVAFEAAAQDATWGAGGPSADPTGSSTAVPHPGDATIGP